jgi:hypothetical protein
MVSNHRSLSGFTYFKDLHYQIPQSSNLIVEDIGVEPMTLSLQS